jgi:hypothetical protein
MGRARLEKLIVAQLVKKFYDSYEIPKVLYRTPLDPIQSQQNPVHTLQTALGLTSILILSFHPRKSPEFSLHFWLSD